MGKGTDKLYITHSEWASEDQFSASAGAGVRQGDGSQAAFKRLPFNFCALSLQPFQIPVCTSQGQIFDHENIIRWLMKHDNNPIDGSPLKQGDLIKLNFTQNEANDYVDPVTFKIFTDNTHIVAIRHGSSANVFAYDTIERLNIKAKMWRDLMSDEEFSRKDVIALQDPKTLENRNFSSFKYVKDQADTGVPKQEPSINEHSLGNAAKIARAKEAVAKARADKARGTVATSAVSKTARSTADKAAQAPRNASHYTTGLAAASFTSTGVTPHTSAALALLSDEEYLLRKGKVKGKGYVKLETSLGDLTLELETEHAPKAVWNFVRLTQKGYYNGIKFHRNIKNFMIQGGDPSGTGKGGASIWGKNFEDEFDGPLKHDSGGILSMANKGKDTNSSQFFITYRAAPHLNRKHTIFGRVAEGLTTLKSMEAAPVDTSNRPEEDIIIHQATVLIDPFEDYKNKQKESEDAERAKEIRQKDGLSDDKVTWTGKRIRRDGTVQETVGVGKYLGTTAGQPVNYDDGDVGDDQPKKKVKSGGGFGNFDGW